MTQIKPDNPKLLNEAELRSMLNLSRSSIYRLLRIGVLPEPIKVGLRTRRWRLDSIEQWLRERDASHE